MQLLQKLDKSGFGPVAYTEALDSLLLKKMNDICELREKLHLFKDHLKQEECVSAALAHHDKIEETKRFVSSQAEIENQLPTIQGQVRRDMMESGPYYGEGKAKRREPVDKRQVYNRPQGPLQSGLADDINLLDNLNNF